MTGSSQFFTSLKWSIYLNKRWLSICGNQEFFYFKERFWMQAILYTKTYQYWIMNEKDSTLETLLPASNELGPQADAAYTLELEVEIVPQNLPVEGFSAMVCIWVSLFYFLLPRRWSRATKSESTLQNWNIFFLFVNTITSSFLCFTK